MEWFILLLPIVCLLMIAGWRVGFLTGKTFMALAKDLESRGCPLDRADAAVLYKAWGQNPESIVSPNDSNEVKAIKLSHASSFAKVVRPWKLGIKLGPILAAVVGFVLFYLRQTAQQ